jgi:hypothetical protein
VNADGYDDIAVGQPGKGYVYLGGPSGPQATPVWSDTGTVDFSLDMITAGDVNGDGFDDLLVGDLIADSPTVQRTGAAYLYFGNPTGLSATPDWVSWGDGIYETSFGMAVSGAGDVDGDGYDDIAIAQRTAWGYPPIPGNTWLYLGSAGGPGATPAWKYPYDGSGTWPSGVVAPAGDIDQDGYDDLLLSDPLFDAHSVGDPWGRATIFLGESGGLGSSPVWDRRRETTTAGWGYARALDGAVLGAADVDGNGFPEVLIGDPVADIPGVSETGRAYAFTICPP